MTSDVIAVRPDDASTSRRRFLTVIVLIAAVAIGIVLLVQAGFIFAADPMTGT